MDLSDNDSDATVLDGEEEATGQAESLSSTTEHEEEPGTNSPAFLTCTGDKLTLSVRPSCQTSSRNLPLDPGDQNLIREKNGCSTHWQHQSQEPLPNVNGTPEATSADEATLFDGQGREPMSQVNEQVMESPGTTNCSVSSPSLLHSSLKSLLDRRGSTEPLVQKDMGVKGSVITENKVQR